MSDELNVTQPIEEPSVVEVVSVVEEKPKAKKQKAPKEESVSDSIEAKYLLLKDAARNLIKLYAKNHTVRGPEDLRFPGLKELAEALKD
jgi:hypothetical protein